MTISDRCLSLCQPSYVQQLAINTMSSPSSSSSSTTTTAVVEGRSSSCYIITHRSIVIMRLLLIACATFIITISLPIASAQETDSSTEPTDINTIDSAESSSQVCRSNEIFDGKMCKCAPG
ncbi:unnamed protein product [Onchocerca flexuosa]|uniref:Secreted protein n=1 Tax=Onchocerca flexuosa TaxID=387005 RepID=A0A183HJY0_9BILA|nr:unnamed protein product [Onchocerca flexuosa]